MSEEALPRVKPAPPLRLQGVANNPHRASSEQHHPSGEGEHREKGASEEEKAAVVTIGTHNAGVLATYAQFVIDPETREVRVRIVNAATQEVLEEVSPEEVASFYQDLERYQRAVARNWRPPPARS